MTVNTTPQPTITAKPLGFEDIYGSGSRLSSPEHARPAAEEVLDVYQQLGIITNAEANGLQKKMAEDLNELRAIHRERAKIIIPLLVVNLPESGRGSDTLRGIAEKYKAMFSNGMTINTGDFFKGDEWENLSRATLNSRGVRLQEGSVRGLLIDIGLRSQLKPVPERPLLVGRQRARLQAYCNPTDVIAASAVLSLYGQRRALPGTVFPQFDEPGAHMMYRCEPNMHGAWFSYVPNNVPTRVVKTIGLSE